MSVMKALVREALAVHAAGFTPPERQALQVALDTDARLLTLPQAELLARYYEAHEAGDDLAATFLAETRREVARLRVRGAAA